jgi:hypothetical protein
MPPQHISPRQEYRRQESQRVADSASLAVTFHQLKSLTVDLAQFGPEGLSKTNEIKYTVNLTNAKSLFQFHCANPECVGGDFDLSTVLAQAIAIHAPMASGELVCNGWRNKVSIDRVRCKNILRYRLNLGYA